MAAVWYYLKNGQRQGPVTAGDLKVLADGGKLLPDDLVWKEGMAGWEPSKSVKGLFEPTRPENAMAVGAVPFPNAPTTPIASERTPEFARSNPSTPRFRVPGSVTGGVWFPWVTLFLASAGFLLSLWALMRGSPMGKGLGSYDLSTPEASVKSLWQIQANRDFLAREELADLHGDPAEVLRTLEIKETIAVPAKNMKVVFFSFKRNSKERHDYWGFVKHAGKEAWIKRHVSDFDVEAAQPDVARKMRDWRSKEFDPLAPD